MNVDDVYLVQHHHWALDTSSFPDERQRLQLAFIILLCAYTGSRPGALVYVKRNNEVLTQCALGSDGDVGDRMDLEPDEINEIVETLCYKHVTLIFLPNPDCERDILAMEVDLQFTKGHKRNYKR
jgi:hypothetical protein